MSVDRGRLRFCLQRALAALCPAALPAWHSTGLLLAAQCFALNQNHCFTAQGFREANERRRAQLLTETDAPEPLYVKVSVQVREFCSLLPTPPAILVLSLSVIGCLCAVPCV